MTPMNGLPPLANQPCQHDTTFKLEITKATQNATIYWRKKILNEK